MKNDFCLLRGTVSQLRKGEIDEKRFLLIFSIFAFFSYLFGGRPFLKGKYFYCYVGNHPVDGRLEQIDFNNGDYVEMLVKPPLDYDTYECYVVRIPQQHALIFPNFIGVSTFRYLRMLFILMTFFVVVISIVWLIVGICVGVGNSLDYYFNVVKYSFWGWIIASVFFFFAAGGGYTFFSNQILACLGYAKPWHYDVEAETKRFKRLHRTSDPEIFNDPLTPDFKKLKMFKGGFYYYCRTPILPSWLKVIG